MEPYYYKPNEVAELLRVTKQTCYKLLRTGEIPSTRVGGQFRVSRRDLEEYVKASRRGAPAG